MNVDWPTLIIGAIPGCIALVGAAVGHGRAMQRLTQVEADVAKLADLKSQMATVVERTSNMAENMKTMSESVTQITGHLLSESRSFQAPVPRRRGS